MKIKICIINSEMAGIETAIYIKPNVVGNSQYLYDTHTSLIKTIKYKHEERFFQRMISRFYPNQIKQ